MMTAEEKRQLEELLKKQKKEEKAERDRERAKLQKAILSRYGMTLKELDEKLKKVEDMAYEVGKLERLYRAYECDSYIDKDALIEHLMSDRQVDYYKRNVRGLF